MSKHDAKIALYRQMTGGQSPTPLQELFGAIAIPLCAGSVHLRVWYTLEGWHASWGQGGAVGGRGATPEDAILQAHTNFISLRDHNALRERVAAVKRRRPKNPKGNRD